MGNNARAALRGLVIMGRDGLRRLGRSVGADHRAVTIVEVTPMPWAR
jgi:hypothetical protein